MKNPSCHNADPCPAWPGRHSPRLGRWLLLALLGAMFTWGLTGCGYQFEGRGPQATFPTEVKTVAVPIFANRTFYRGVEFDLTESLIKAIELRTPYKVVQAGSADSQLSGAIVRIDQTRLSRQAEGGMPEEVELRVAVDLEWKNLRTGEVMRQRQGLAAVGRYIPARPVGENQQLSQHEAVGRLTDSIIAMMRANW